MKPQSLIRLDLREWSRYPPDEAALLPGMVWPDDARMQELVQALGHQKKIRIVELRRGLMIETTSWVGRITLGNLEITVQPKLHGLPLVRLLRYAYGLGEIDLITDAEFAASSHAFQDLVISELAREAKRLIGRGLRREYLRREASLSVPRGRIDMNHLVRAGGVVSAELPCTMHERREDTALNQILRAGLAFGARLAQDLSLRTKMRRLASLLSESVASVPLTSHALSGAERSLSRLTAAYRPALTLIRLLWENQGIDLEAGHPMMELPGFLFDMNRFFQRLVSRFLSENLPEFRLEDESRFKGTFVYDPTFNPRRTSDPILRPDYILWEGPSVVAVLDAKYRDLWATSLPPEWLYQLAIYALSQNQKSVILYATIGDAASEAHIDVRSPAHGHRLAQVILRPVDLKELDRVLCAGTGTMAARNRQVLARQLAFGPTEH